MTLELLIHYRIYLPDDLELIEQQEYEQRIENVSEHHNLPRPDGMREAFAITLIMQLPGTCC